MIRNKIILIWLILLLFMDIGNAAFSEVDSDDFTVRLVVVESDYELYFSEVDSDDFTVRLVVVESDYELYDSTQFNITVYVCGWGDWYDWWAFDLEEDIYPSSFTVTHINSSIINLSWTNHANATHTRIQRSKTSTPSSPSSGTNVYNNTGTTYSDTGLDYGTLYYYSAWGYNNSTNSFSNTYAYDSNYTNPGPPVYLHDTNTMMYNISLEWTKGTNATRTVIRYSNATYPANAQSNDSAYNDTSNTTTVTGLTANITYYFRAWSYNPTSGLFSEGNASDSANTTESAKPPSSITAIESNHTRIVLNWTKNGSDNTLVRRRTDTYPNSTTDGTQVYYGVASIYSDESLTPATHYYYSAWGWNGEAYSSTYVTDDNRTRPAPPTSLVGRIEGTDLNITWTKGTGATNTVIRRRNDTYPTNYTNGTLIYNGTGTMVLVAGVSDINYYRGWSYTRVDGTPMYSNHTNLVWGGLEINVYNESNTSQGLTFDVFITDEEGSETYLDTSCTNPHRIDVNDCPNGDNIAIQISATGYNTRYYYLDIYENQWYVLNAYLPVALPPGGATSPDYDENETYSYLYYIQVLDVFSQPVEDAKIEVKRYINTTGEFENISVGFTDANGFFSVYLYADTIHKLKITKDGFITLHEEYIPDPIYYGIYYPKIFILSYETTEPDVITPVDYLRVTGTLYTNSTMHVTYLDIANETIDTTFYVYEYYDETETLINVTNSTGTNNFSFWIYSVNTTIMHIIRLYSNHTTLGYVEGFTVYVPPLPSDRIDAEWIDTILGDVAGDWMFSYSLTLLLYLPVIFITLGLAKVGTPGLGVIGAGLYAFFVTWYVEFNIETKIIMFAAICIIIGFIGTVIKKGKGWFQ
jgi:hypothetical protein